MVQRRVVLSSLVMLSASSVVLPTLSSGLYSNLEAVQALRMALEKSAKSAVLQLGQVDGFLGNQKVRIGLPSVLEGASSLLRTLGKGRMLDELVTSMNRAAEQATPMALPLLKSAIKSMGVDDAQKILTGGDTSLTDFFASKTRQPLSEKFLPIVTRTTNRLSVSKNYNNVAGKASSMGLLKPEQSTVQQYVTDKALDGIFAVISEQERLIRQNPVATGSAIIKKVFGSF